MALRSLSFAAALCAVAAVADPNRRGRFTRPLNGRYNTSSSRVEGVLNVHIVPHTHDDVGWLKTVDQYYYGAQNGIQRAEVQNIISSVIKELAWNPDRKFIYIEQAFFQRWWAEADSKSQQLVQQLVASGQLEFINGGWCMHDEANPSFIDMIDQTTLGHRLLLEQFGSMPKTTWQIDPFGHSAFQATAFGPQSGFNALFFARADYQDYNARSKNGTMEMFWAPSASQGLNAGLLTGIMSGGYGPPGGLDMAEWSSDDPIMDDETLEGYNVGTIIDNFVNDANNRQSEVRGSDIMEYFGSDFNYENANTWFTNIDKLIHYANQDGRVNVFYSTPSIYATAKIESASYPLKTDDFMPYADCPNCFWTGYMTSRAALKGYVRETSNVFTVARQLQAFTGGAHDMSPTNPLYHLERSLGVAQHHDAVAGTEKQAVAYDYAVRLAAGRALAYPAIQAALQQLTGAATAEYVGCDLANVTICPALESGVATVIILYNSQSHARTAPVRVPVGLPTGVASYSAFDSSAQPIVAQLTPPTAVDAALRTEYYAYNSATPVSWLNFIASVPAMGYAAYFITPSSTTASAPLTHVSKPQLVAVGSGDSTVSNGIVSLTFDGMTGLLKGYTNAANGVTEALTQNWVYYRSSEGNKQDGQASGAYIFRPNVSTAFPVSEGSPVTVTLVTGPIVNEAYQVFNNWTSQHVRLWANTTSVDFEYTVGPINFYDNWGKEIVTQYGTGLATNGTWYTDSNLRDSIKRVRNYRSSWNYTVNQNVSGNYAPVNSFIWTSDISSGVTLTVNNDRSQGGASIVDGEVEIMVHRRILADDGRGVGEPLNETGLDGKGLIIRGLHRLSLDVAAAAPIARRSAIGDVMQRPLQQFAPLGAATPASWVAVNKAVYSGLAAPVAPQLEVITAHSWGPNQLLVRVAHSYEAGDGPLGANASVSLTNLFSGFNLTDITEMTLTANRPLADVPTTTYKIDGIGAVSLPVVPPGPAGPAATVTLAPMQIRTFRCSTTSAAASD